MDSLANYGSDDDCEDSSDEGQTDWRQVDYNKKPPQRTSTSIRQEDANYEEVQMDLSEESNDGSKNGKETKDRLSEDKRSSRESPSDSRGRNDNRNRRTDRRSHERSRSRDRNKDRKDDRYSSKSDRYGRDDKSSSRRDSYRDRKYRRSSSRDRRRSSSKDRRRSVSKDRRRSGSKDRRRSGSKDRRRSGSKDRRRSGSKDRRRSGSKDRRRSDSRDRDRRRSSSRERRYSRSPKRDRSRRSRSRSRSRGRYGGPRGRYGYPKSNGPRNDATETSVTSQPGENKDRFFIPGITGKYREQIEKRKLLWQKKEPQSQPETTVQAQLPAASTSTSRVTKIWEATTFAQDQDGKVASKFKRLMGIKGQAQAAAPVPPTDIIKKQEEMFSSMEQQYEVARTATHTMRGVGLGFSSNYPR